METGISSIISSHENDYFDDRAKFTTSLFFPHKHTFLNKYIYSTNEFVSRNMFLFFFSYPLHGENTIYTRKQFLSSDKHARVHKVHD